MEAMEMAEEEMELDDEELLEPIREDYRKRHRE
jgi:hypothetical protein